MGAQVRDSLPVPSLPGYKTLKGDFHIHTVFSDGEVWPTTRVSEAWSQGLDVIALTDHAGTHPHRSDVKVDLRRPDEIARPLGDRLGIILIPGVEIAEGNLHCNALFVTDPNVFTGRGLLDALRRAKAQGAFIFWNHPGWKRKPEWFPLIASAYDEHLIQGAELVNGLDFYPEAFPWFHQRSLTIFANSDVHVPATAEYSKRTRPVTLLFVRTADSAGVREALDARRTAAWMGGQVWGDEEYLAGLWRGAIVMENPHPRFPRGVAATTLRLRNRSAIPFRLRVVDTPTWLGVGAGEIAAESLTGINLSVADAERSGTRNVEVQFEVQNLHTSPGVNLKIRVPLTVEIDRPEH